MVYIAQERPSSSWMYTINNIGEHKVTLANTTHLALGMLPTVPCDKVWSSTGNNPVGSTAYSSEKTRHTQIDPPQTIFTACDSDTGHQDPHQSYRVHTLCWVSLTNQETGTLMEMSMYNEIDHLNKQKQACKTVLVLLKHNYRLTWSTLPGYWRMITSRSLAAWHSASSPTSVFNTYQNADFTWYMSYTQQQWHNNKTKSMQTQPKIVDHRTFHHSLRTRGKAFNLFPLSIYNQVMRYLQRILHHPFQTNKTYFLKNINQTCGPVLSSICSYWFFNVFFLHSHKCVFNSVSVQNGTHKH